jgi:hypothetical protein
MLRLPPLLHQEVKGENHPYELALYGVSRKTHTHSHHSRPLVFVMKTASGNLALFSFQNLGLYDWHLCDAMWTGGGRVRTG